MSEIKEEVSALLERLPEDASIEDLQYSLYVVDKVQKGLKSIEGEGGLTPDEAEARLSKWLVS